MKQFLRTALIAVFAAFPAFAVTAQTTTPAAPARADDTPTLRVGAVIFADYTYQASPESIDSDGNAVHLSSFNITRSYINLIGSLNHMISFRVTPDIARETGSGSSLSGSYTFRLKNAYGQLNLDDWTTKGSWVRLGLQQTAFLDYAETVYRYRFQGPIFVDREGFVISSDSGLSGHWNFPGDYGDVQAGVYNGEGYAKAELNNEKSLQVRASVRPLPSNAVLRGLRITGFINSDHPVAGAERQRVIGEVTFEHPRVNAGFDYLTAKDSSSAAKPVTDANGYSIWITPKFGSSGWEALLRHDELQPNKSTDQKRRRNIVGIAYWLQHLNKVSAALMVDYDSLAQSNFSPSRPNDTRYGLKMLVSF